MALGDFPGIRYWPKRCDMMTSTQTHTCTWTHTHTSSHTNKGCAWFENRALTFKLDKDRSKDTDTQKQTNTGHWFGQWTWRMLWWTGLRITDQMLDGLCVCLSEHRYMHNIAQMYRTGCQSKVKNQDEEQKSLRPLPCDPSSPAERPRCPSPLLGIIPLSLLEPQFVWSVWIGFKPCQTQLY